MMNQEAKEKQERERTQKHDLEIQILQNLLEESKERETRLEKHLSNKGVLAEKMIQFLTKKVL